MSGSVSPRAAARMTRKTRAVAESREAWRRIGGPLDQALAIFNKELRAEIRNRTALSSILLFTVTAMVIVAFAVGKAGLPPDVKGALLWVVLFFAAFSGLSHVFLHEEETGTVHALRLSASAGAVYTGKLLFNLLLLLGITAVVTPLFVLMLEFQPRNPAAFMLVIVTGGIGLGAAATIVAAILAKARGKGALYGALGFPILLPLLIMAVDATPMAVAGRGFSDRLLSDIVGLAAYSILMITASALLFPSVWED